MSDAEAPVANPQSVKVKLSTPISRKGGDITELTLRKPKAGQMRGLKIEDLFSTDVNSLLVLLPRITEPTLIAAEIEDMEPEDLIELAGAVKGFFMSAEMKAAINKALGGQ
jgi:hypothetical protein